MSLRTWNWGFAHEFKNLEWEFANKFLQLKMEKGTCLYVIEFLIENDQVQKINEVFIETQTPVIIKIHCSHTMKSHQMIVILSQHLSVT